MNGFLKIVRADIWDIRCDTVSLPMNASFDFCPNVLRRGGPALEKEMTAIRGHYQRKQNTFPFTFHKVQPATSGNITQWKKIMLTFYGPISDPINPTDIELCIVRQAFKELLSIVRRKGYSAIATAVPYSDNAAAKHSSIMTEISHTIIDKINETDLKDVYFVVPIEDKNIASDIAGLIGGYNVWLNSNDVLKKILKRLAPPSSTIMSSTNKRISKLTSLVKKVYHCHVCSKAYSSPSALNRHLRDNHVVEVDLEEVSSINVNANLVDSTKEVRTESKGNSACYFSTAHTKLKICKGYVLQLSDVDRAIDLYGASSALDLLILRGSGESEKTHESEKNIMESYVCENHLNEVLLKWNDNRVFNKKRSAKEEKPRCSLPNAIRDGPTIPVSFRRLGKNDAVLFMNATYILCHVGVAICYTHYMAFTENRIKDIALENDKDDTVVMSEGEESQYSSNSNASSGSSPPSDLKTMKKSRR